MNSRTTRLSLFTASLLACAMLALAATAGASTAQDAQPTSMKPMHGQNMPMHEMHHRGMHRHHAMMGRHNMPGTVTSVDHATGIVKLDSLGMHLIVHFPPPTISHLKAGDKISLHLGYRIIGQ